MQVTDLARVPGVAECALSGEFAERLPQGAPAPPWECRADALVWLGRGGATARRALPDGVREGRSALGVVGGMVRYTETPVGQYDEVFGGVAFRQGATVRAGIPFMAVDSEASLVGGRSNWALPKTMAEFEGRTASGMTATGEGWQVRTRVRPCGPALPVRSGATIVQQWPDGHARAATMWARARAQPAVVTVSVDSNRQPQPSLPGWLRPGKHLGLVVGGLWFTLGPARPA